MADGLGDPIEIDETNIALWADRNHRFNVADTSNTWLNLSSEHVMVWYEMESQKSFIKLWGHVGATLKANSTYVLTINNNWLDVSQFGGSKYVYLSETSNVGGNQ